MIDLLILIEKELKMNHKIIGLLFLIYIAISSLSLNTACQAGSPDLAQLLSYHADKPFNQKVVDTQEKQDIIIRKHRI